MNILKKCPIRFFFSQWLNMKKLSVEIECVLHNQLKIWQKFKKMTETKNIKPKSICFTHSSFSSLSVQRCEGPPTRLKSEHQPCSEKWKAQVKSDATLQIEKWIPTMQWKVKSKSEKWKAKVKSEKWTAKVKSEATHQIEKWTPTMQWKVKSESEKWKVKPPTRLKPPIEF